MVWFKKIKTRQEIEEEKLKAEMWKARFDAIFVILKSISAAASMFVAVVIFLGNSGWISYKFVKSHTNTPTAVGESVVETDKEVVNYESKGDHKKVAKKTKIIDESLFTVSKRGNIKSGGGGKTSSPFLKKKIEIKKKDDEYIYEEEDYEVQQTALSEKKFRIPLVVYNILLYLLAIIFAFHTIWKMTHNKKHGKKWME